MSLHSCDEKCVFGYINIYKFTLADMFLWIFHTSALHIGYRWWLWSVLYANNLHDAQLVKTIHNTITLPTNTLLPPPALPFTRPHPSLLLPPLPLIYPSPSFANPFLQVPSPPPSSQPLPAPRRCRCRCRTCARPPPRGCPACWSGQAGSKCIDRQTIEK